jgi:hypothetical protein
LRLILILTAHIQWRKTGLASLLMLMCMPLLRAQKYGLDIQFGQQYGINKTVGYDAPPNTLTQFSMGSGINRQIMLHIYPDSSNWYMSAGFSYFRSNPVITSSRENLPMDYRVATSALHSLRLLARLSYLVKINKFSLNFSAGVIVPLSARAREEFYTRDSVEKTKTTSIVKSNVALGFNGAVGIHRQITPRIRLFLNTDINILNHYVKSRKVIAYDNSRGRTLESAYPDIASRETIYHRDLAEIRNNKDLPRPRFDKNLPTDKMSYRVTDSGVSIQIVFLFLF